MGGGGGAATPSLSEPNDGKIESREVAPPPFPLSKFLDTPLKILAFTNMMNAAMILKMLQSRTEITHHSCKRNSYAQEKENAFHKSPSHNAYM